MHFFQQAFSDKERPVQVVPKWLILILTLAFFTQLGWHAQRPAAIAIATQLPEPPSMALLQAVSLDESAALSRILMFWLQAFDNQPGISLPFSELDYNTITAWLERCLQLDQKAQYPLLAASRLYTQVPDEKKQRIMLEFVHKKFFEDPSSRWPWLTHAVFVAKHRLKDPELALSYARSLRIHATAEHVPTWAKQMELFILEDLDDVEGAKILLGGLLESGAIKDPNEIKFLKQRLGVR